jgi:hypothetical protein
MIMGLRTLIKTAALTERVIKTNTVVSLRQLKAGPDKFNDNGTINAQIKKPGTSSIAASWSPQQLLLSPSLVTPQSHEET